MRNFDLPLAGLLVATLAACGTVPVPTSSSASAVQQPIIQGEPAQGAFPSVAFILIDGTSKGADGGLAIDTMACTGTFISSTVVLTAAHCAVSGGSAADPTFLSQGRGMHIFLGDDARDQVLPPGSPAANVADVKVHPGFRIEGICAAPRDASEQSRCAQGMPQILQACANLTGDALTACLMALPDNLTPLVRAPVDANAADAALLFLDHAVEQVGTMALAESSDANALKAGAQAQVVGYGNTRVHPSSEAPQPVTPQNIGQADVGIKRIGTVTMRQVFATAVQLDDGDPNSGTRPCHGDSGGPLVIEGPNKEPLLAGIASRGSTGDCQSLIYTRADAVADWVKQATLQPATTASDAPEHKSGCQMVQTPFWALVWGVGLGLIKAHRRSRRPARTTS